MLITRASKVDYLKEYWNFVKTRYIKPICVNIILVNEYAISKFSIYCNILKVYPDMDIKLLY